MFLRMPKGVQKVSEHIIGKGRSLLFIDCQDEESEIDFKEIPDGAIKVHPKTGQISVKIEGESDWIPSANRNNDIVCMGKEAVVVEEMFMVQEDQEKDKHGHYVFELQKARYQPLKDRIQAFREKERMMVEEMSSKKFAIADTLEPGQIITVRYVQITGVSFFNTVDMKLSANEVHRMETAFPFGYNIKLYIYNDNEDSVTYKRYINAEGMVEIAYDYAEDGNHAIEFHNMLDREVTLKVVYSCADFEEPRIISNIE